MTKAKKTSPFMRQLSRFIAMLIIFSIIGIGYLALRDAFMTPAEQFEAAQTYEREQQFKKAERYYLIVADGDDENLSKLASYYLGMMYKKGGKGFPVNGKKAEMFLESSAIKGLSQAQYELALMYDIGDKIPENRAKAIAWMNQAAQQNNPDALYGLGVWAERGYLGKPDMDKIVTLYEKAAEQGQVNAMTSLVAIYSGGFGGFPQNIQKAVYWQNQLTTRMSPQPQKQSNEGTKTSSESVQEVKSVQDKK